MEFTLEPKPIEVPSTPVGGEYLDNVKKIRTSDGRYSYDAGVVTFRDSAGTSRREDSTDGSIKMYDASGNLVILFDPN